MPQLRGKNVLFIPDGPTSSYGELQALLAPLNVRDGLRVLGDLFSKLNSTVEKNSRIEGTLVPSFAVPPLALELILASDDTKSGQIDDQYLARLVPCFHCLPWPDIEGQRGIESMLRMGQSQFSFQKSDPHRLARIARVFRDLWHVVPEAAALDIQEATREAFGTDLDATLLFGFAFSARSRQGYVSQYLGTQGDDRVTALFTPAAQERFLGHLSKTYDDVRQMAASRPVTDELRKYRFNPLAVYPLVLPDEQPPDAQTDVRLVPCSKFLLDRVTEGLVFDGRKRFGQAFNDAFGHVVERYVGDLLRESFGDHNTKGDFSYRVQKKKFLSPDWSVFGHGRAVVIEVKKTLLQPDARAFGLLSQVRADLKNTLQKAVSQLSTFRRHVHLLREYPSAPDIEFVVATWDDTWWASSLLMKEIAGVPDGLHIHVISVHDLERILTFCDSPDSLQQLLWAKRNGGEDSAEMDMADWLSRLPGGSAYRPLKSLVRVQDEFFSHWGLDSSVPNAND